MLDSPQQTSIPLIYLNSDPEPKFVLNPKALQIIKSHSNNHTISFISICGDYRSGKSFLMNSLFFSKEGFKVSPTTEPCTKGINMWSKPISANGKSVWILDTEGFGAIDRDQSHDVKIFLLTTLISSIVMYNSFGALDENTINKLAAICLKAQQMDPTLSKLKMFWILRDFSLKIQSKQGRQLTPDEYLNEALDDSTHKQQRSAIKKVFTERFCIPLVRPVIDEKALAQLNEIKFQELRGQFVEEIYKLRKKMLSMAEGKMIQGMGLAGGNLETFLGKYVNMLNHNEIDTCVSSTWDSIVKHEREKRSSQIIDKLRQIVTSKSEFIPLSSQQLDTFTQHLDSLAESQMVQFRKHFRDEEIIKLTENQVFKYKSELVQNFKLKNSERVLSDSQTVLKSIFEGLEKGLGKDFGGDVSLVMKYVQKMFKTKDDYFSKFNKFMAESFQSQAGKSQSKILKNSGNNVSLVTRLMYFEEFYTQQKHLLPKLIGQFSEEMASTIIKLNEQKKTTKRQETELKQVKEENHTLHEEVKKLSDKLTANQRSLNEIQKLSEIKQHEIQTISTKSQNEYLQLKAEYEENIEELKETILALEKNFMSLKKETELEKTEHNDKLKYLNERHEMALNKLEQSRSMNQKAIDQVKEQYEEKLKRAEEKFQEVQNQLLSERKKFTELNKSKKEEESQLLEDLAQKNEKLLNLRREFVNVEHSYKEQLEMIIKEQKALLTNEFTLQLEENHHRLMVYEQKLEQYMVRITQLEEVQRKYETILIEHRLLSEEHEVLAVKYSEVVSKLKKSGQMQEEREGFFQAIKEKYVEEIKVKEEMLKNFKLQLKTSEQEHTQAIAELQQRHQKQLANLKEQLQQKHQEKLTQKLSSLENSHKQEKNELREQLKETYQEVEELKLIKGKLTNDQTFVKELIKRVFGDYERMEKEVKSVMKKYKKMDKEMKLQENSQILHEVNSQLEASSLDMSLLNDSTLNQNPVGQQYSKNISLRQLCQELESCLSPLFNQHKTQAEQLEDLKNSFKETISQLEQCQTHINTLNGQIRHHQGHIKTMEGQLSEYKEKKHWLSEIEGKMNEMKKQNELLRNEVQVRDEIYNKREASIRQNIELYKQTIANLTEENQLLGEKSTKLQIELNRFTQWQTDLISPAQNNTYSYYPKSKSNMSSLEYLNENQEADENEYVAREQIEQLSKENRRLKKELHQHKEMLLLGDASKQNGNHQNSKSSNNLLTNILFDNNNVQIIEALKKQNTIYKQRVQELRERELKLLEEVKVAKQNQKISSEGRLNLARQEFDSYRRKVKEEMMEMEKIIEQLNQDKYKLKQEMLIMRQNERQFSSQKVSMKDGYRQIEGSHAESSHYPLSKTYSNESVVTIESLEQTIQSLKHQNLKLQTQLASTAAQLVKTKDDSDKKMASLQLMYEERIRQLQSEKARIQLQNQKNKTKYEHLLKVNNDLIVEVDNFKARANNQMTLKEKYKHKISSLFMDD